MGHGAWGMGHGAWVIGKKSCLMLLIKPELPYNIKPLLPMPYGPMPIAHLR
ncbi:MAG: hypothetical protein KME33_08140 [Aetokthonos hydrillicola CCALA 1050]|nr:hypothetical protein [Aetokthonos hydrillicola CCALA 1050]